MIVQAIVAQELVQEQFDLLMLQAFNLNLVSFGRNTALDVPDVLSEKVYGSANLIGKLCEVYDLLLLLRFSNRF